MPKPSPELLSLSPMATGRATYHTSRLFRLLIQLTLFCGVMAFSGYSLAANYLRQPATETCRVYTACKTPVRTVAYQRLCKSTSQVQATPLHIYYTAAFWQSNQLAAAKLLAQARQVRTIKRKPYRQLHTAISQYPAGETLPPYRGHFLLL